MGRSYCFGSFFGGIAGFDCAAGNISLGKNDLFSTMFRTSDLRISSKSNHQPLARLDGLGSLTISPRKSPGASSPQALNAKGFWGSQAVASKTKEADSITDTYFSRVAPSVYFDPHRNLLTWALPSQAPASAVDHRGDYELESLSPNSPQAKKEHEDRAFFSKWVVKEHGNGGFVKVWDFTLVNRLISSNASETPSTSSPRPPPRMPPIAIMKLPVSVASAASLHNVVIAGLLHEPITAASLACLCLSKDGSKLLVYAAPLPRVVDTFDEEAETQQSLPSESPVKSKQKRVGGRAVKPKILFVNYTPCHSVSLAGNGVMPPFTTGSAIAASFLNPDFVGVATDQGVAIASLADGESWSTKLDPVIDSRDVTLLCSGASHDKDDSSSLQTRPSRIPIGPRHTIISYNGVGNRPGILYVENYVVYASRLGTIRAALNDSKQALIGNVELPGPMMLCKLHGRKLLRSIRSTFMSSFVQSSQPIKCPPRLVSSPSGRYLCLYWGSTETYEVLHAASLLAREQNNPGGTSNALDSLVQHRVTPSVDSGRNVLSFAWVGDDDNFAVLRQHSHPCQYEHESEDGDSIGGSFPKPSSAKGKQDRPQVELFKLAEVRRESQELEAGASVAAATTVSLGSLIVRGGDHVIPNVLFGGPSLCVGCKSLSNSAIASNEEGFAYFYSRKSGAVEEHDERASVYTTIGTSIPYPDIVSWDEYGQLCAISYGSRVTVYLSEESAFILLGSVQITSKTQLPLVSIKFIHGVLYCSTKTSVHVIFLGNLGEGYTVCELDVYTIATNGVPLHGLDNPDLSFPVPAITALIQPHILAYHQGGLLVSSSCGLQLLPLSHPIIRIGTLLAANLIDRARKWILAFPKSEHENLAHFLIRRGHVDLAISDLNGLPLQTYIDLCIRHERTDKLEHLINAHGPEIIPEISDWGRGDVNSGYSGYLAIGLYMLGKGRLDCAKKLVSQAIESELGALLVDGMKLSTFISVVHQHDGNTLLQKVIQTMKFNANGKLALVNIVKWV